MEDFATAPGVTLQDCVDALGMSLAELAQRTGIHESSVGRIIAGVEPITQAFAEALEKVSHVSAGFRSRWNPTDGNTLPVYKWTVTSRRRC
jgi:plasmid maintenance system antidote protein VapI